MPTHTVKLGEHLSGIAEKYGHSNDAIWNHPNNATVKAKRKHPHVLFPGDELFIPNKTLKEEPCATTKVHRFCFTTLPLKLRIALTDFHHQPIANVDCELKIEGAVFKLKSDSTGIVEAVIPASAKTGQLQIKDLGIDCPVKIGYLHPVDEESGWKGRLMNLDYYNDPGAGKDTGQLKSAIEEFQRDHNEKHTGEMNPPTEVKLQKRHGI